MPGSCLQAGVPSVPASSLPPSCGTPATQEDTADLSRTHRPGAEKRSGRTRLGVQIVLRPGGLRGQRLTPLVGWPWDLPLHLHLGMSPPFSMHWLLVFIFDLHVMKMNQSCLYQLQMVLTGASGFWVSMSSLGGLFSLPRPAGLTGHIRSYPVPRTHCLGHGRSFAPVPKLGLPLPWSSAPLRTSVLLRALCLHKTRVKNKNQ